MVILLYWWSVLPVNGSASHGWILMEVTNWKVRIFYLFIYSYLIWNRTTMELVRFGNKVEKKMMIRTTERIVKCVNLRQGGWASVWYCQWRTRLGLWVQGRERGRLESKRFWLQFPLFLGVPMAPAGACCDGAGTHAPLFGGCYLWRLFLCCRGVLERNGTER